jgi:hypothetical protein
MTTLGGIAADGFDRFPLPASAMTVNSDSRSRTSVAAPTAMSSGVMKDRSTLGDYKRATGIRH